MQFLLISPKRQGIFLFVLNACLNFTFYLNSFSLKLIYIFLHFFKQVKEINGKEIKVKSLTFSFMHLLMKVSNHVALLMPETTMSDLQRYTVQTYCDIAFAKHPQFVQLSRESRFCTLSDPKYCGKMQVSQAAFNSPPKSPMS